MSDSENLGMLKLDQTFEKMSNTRSCPLKKKVFGNKNERASVHTRHATGKQGQMVVIYNSETELGTIKSPLHHYLGKSLPEFAEEVGTQLKHWDQ